MWYCLAVQVLALHGFPWTRVVLPELSTAVDESTLASEDASSRPDAIVLNVFLVEVLVTEVSVVGRD